ncbi:MAG TPA: hypothetical protein VMN39_07390, partial [Longimicrobiaceae bacterium]|nr:hypothetical protein [Longimicrobiaceae bacterium]
MSRFTVDVITILVMLLISAWIATRSATAHEASLPGATASLARGAPSAAAAEPSVAAPSPEISWRPSTPAQGHI